MGWQHLPHWEQKKYIKLVITGGNVDVERRRDEIPQPGAIPLSSSVCKRVACYHSIVFSAGVFAAPPPLKLEPPASIAQHLLLPLLRAWRQH